MPWLTPENDAPSQRMCRRVLIPDDPQWVAPITGALLPLTYPYNWEQVGAVTPDQCAAVYAVVLDSWLESVGVCMIGAILPFATGSVPAGCLPCDGSMYARADYPLLYDALDSAFLIDSGTFRTPDMRGRTPIGTGQGSGLTDRAIGDTGGAESVTLTDEQLPSHTHTAQPHTHTTVPHAHQYASPIPNLDLEIAPAAPDVGATRNPAYELTSYESVAVNDSTVTIDAAGSDGPHENMPPFVAVRFFIVAR